MLNNQILFPKPQKRKIKRQGKIIQTASYLPENIISNDDLIRKNNLSLTSESVYQSLGVKNRRIAPINLSDSDLLSKAAVKCLENAQILPDQLSRLIITKYLGDHLMPMTACMVQRKLKCNFGIHSYDIEGGINSYLEALDMARLYINSGDEYVLILSGGIHHCHTSKSDTDTLFLFGDGASATLIGYSEKQHFLSSYFYTNYNYYDLAKSKISMVESARLPDDIYDTKDFDSIYNSYYLTDWKELIRFYPNAAKITRDNLLSKSGMDINDVDLVLITENNEQIRSQTLKAIGVQELKGHSLIQNYGNTMSAMLPLLLDDAMKTKQIHKNQIIMMLSHGEGACGGGIIYRI